MNFRSPIEKLIPSENLGISEVEDLINLLPNATFIFDTSHNKIVGANTKTIELTSYTRTELNTVNIKELLPIQNEFDIFDLRNSGLIPQSIFLHKRNKSKIPINISVIRLPTRGKWSLVTIEPINTTNGLEQNTYGVSGSWDSLKLCFETLCNSDIQINIKRILFLTSVLTGANILCIYQADTQGLCLKRNISQGLAQLLPEQLPIQDLSNLQQPHIWSPGKRLMSDLHRHARISELTYLATIPIGEPKASIGILAIASNQIITPEFTLQNMKLIADLINQIIEQKTRVKNIEEALEHQQKTLCILDSIEKAIQDGIVILTPELIIQKINPSAEKILGYQSNEIAGQHISILFSGLDQLLTAIDTVKNGGSSQNLQNLRLFHRSGQGFTAEVAILSLNMNKGDSEISILIKDHTEQEKLQLENNRLKQRALLGELTSVFAHEVRNPINNISTGLQLMAMDLPPDDPKQDHLTRLQQDCDRLEDLMKTVLIYSKPIESEMEAVDLGVLINRIVDRYQNKINQAKVQCHLYVENDLPKVNGNRRALEQVFNNLIDNALQVMREEGGTLAIKVRNLQRVNDNDHVEVSFADSGLGIPQELTDQIFQYFYTTKPNGTGIGLALSKQIILAHNGLITVDSFPGGTIFSIQLPIHASMNSSNAN